MPFLTSQSLKLLGLMKTSKHHHHHFSQEKMKISSSFTISTLMKNSKHHHQLSCDKPIPQTPHENSSYIYSVIIISAKLLHAHKFKYLLSFTTSISGKIFTQGWHQRKHCRPGITLKSVKRILIWRGSVLCTKVGRTCSRMIMNDEAFRLVGNA